MQTPIELDMQSLYLQWIWAKFCLFDLNPDPISVSVPALSTLARKKKKKKKIEVR